MEYHAPGYPIAIHVLYASERVVMPRRPAFCRRPSQYSSEKPRDSNISLYSPTNWVTKLIKCFEVNVRAVGAQIFGSGTHVGICREHHERRLLVQVGHL